MAVEVPPYDVWSTSSGNRLAGFATRELAEAFVEQLALPNGPFERDDLFIDGPEERDQPTAAP